MSKRKKRKVIPLENLSVRALIDSATEGSDLACALIAAAYIENGLGSLLTKVMLPVPEDQSEQHPCHRLLNDPGGILSAASGRADMCYCLGLIVKTTYDNAKAIARIRNLFAHSHVPIDFTDEGIKHICNHELKAPPLVNKNDKPVDEDVAKKLLAVPRQKFVATALGSFVTIVLNSGYAKHPKPIDHNVRCPVWGDGTSVWGAIVFFNE